MEPIHPRDGCTLYHGDCLDVLRTLPDASVDAVVTDPPYFKVKSEAWDRQWQKPQEFLAWLGRHVEQWHRLLKPNGSLYCFASPQMAARVELLIAERFAVLNHIVWVKADKAGNGMYSRQGWDDKRAFFPQTERIIFAEHYGADNVALGGSGYAAKCDELRGFVFEPLRKYLDDERKRAGFDFEMIRKAVGCAVGSGLPSHWFTRSQWMLPTRENYLKLRAAFNHNTDPHQGEFLRKDYEELRKDYEELRRPFAVSKDVPCTDVWTFATVGYYRGKHPCEKPVDMMRHIVCASTRPGAVVLDPFLGSGSTGVACVLEGRQFIGVELSESYLAVARRRIAEAVPAGESPSRPSRPAQEQPGQLLLWDAPA